MNGLATQLQEVQNRGQQVMKLDILSIQHQLSKIEKEALEQALDEKGFLLKNFNFFFLKQAKGLFSEN